MSLLVLSGRDVSQIIKRHCPVSELLANQASVFRTLSSPVPNTATTTSDTSNDAGQAAFESPHRITLALKNATTLFMPARLGDEVTCKVVGVPKLSSGLSAATTILDGETGTTKAVVNATALTAFRTAAGSVLATLAVQGLTRFNSSRPRQTTIFGSGQQAIHHAALFSSIYSSKDARNRITCSFVARSGLSLTARDELTDLGVQSDDVSVILSHSREEVKESVSSADIIICCTPSQAPLFPNEWVRGGTHIVLVGSYKPTMQEVDVELVHRAQGRIIVDNGEACAKEAGDLIKAGVDGTKCIPLGVLLHETAFSDLARGGLDQLPSSEETQSLIGKLNRSLGVERSGDITIFKSVGVGLQDVAITSLLVAKAIENGMGQQVHF